MKNNLDIAYAAGFFDGEGCIFIDQNNHAYTLEVTIGQNKKDPLEWIRERYGGSLRLQNSETWTGPKWLWKLRSDQALLFLIDILPYLIVKKEQASTAIEYQSNKITRAGKRTSEEEIIKRDYYKKLVSSLNNTRRNMSPGTQ